MECHSLVFDYGDFFVVLFFDGNLVSFSEFTCKQSAIDAALDHSDFWDFGEPDYDFSGLDIF